jgi:DNA-binding LacI/PurR family transcriptional regulator
MVSILHIGFPLAPPLLTADESEKIAARLTGIRQRMEEAGYRYVVMHASPQGGLEDFRSWLRTEPCDVVLIGGVYLLIRN